MGPNHDIEELGKGPLTEGDGQGIGPTLGENLSAEEKRRRIERGVFERRKPPEDGGAPHEPAQADADPGAGAKPLDEETPHRPH